MILCCCRDLTSKERNTSTWRQHYDSIELKVKTMAKELWTQYSELSDRQREFRGLTDPDYQEKLDTVLQWRWGGVVCYTGNPLVCLLVVSCFVINSDGKLPQQNQGILIAQTLQKRRYGSLHQVKYHDQFRCLQKAKGIQNKEWKIPEKVVKIVKNTTSHQVTSYRNKDCNCHEYFLILFYYIYVFVCRKYLCFLFSYSVIIYHEIYLFLHIIFKI